MTLRVLAILPLALYLTGCGKGDTKLIENPKSIALLGSTDTILAERSAYWNTPMLEAAVKENRQAIQFEPGGKLTYYAYLENMGGVPLKRDTIRATKTLKMEEYLRTITKDTNMILHIESSDRTKGPTEVVVYIRNRPDSAYKLIQFKEGKPKEAKK